MYVDMHIHNNIFIMLCSFNSLNLQNQGGKCHNLAEFQTSMKCSVDTKTNIIKIVEFTYKIAPEI